MKIRLITVIGFLMFLTGCSNSNNNDPAREDQVTPAALEEEAPTMADLSAVTDIRQLLCQTWEHKEDAEDAEATGGGGSFEMPYRGLSFFSDGTVTENPRDKMRFGKWNFNEEKKLIEIEFGNRVKASYKIGAIGPKQMILLNMADKKKTIYRADASAQIVPANDPFHPSNNQWRIKPSQSEPDSLIKSRVKEAVMFYAKFLKDNGARQRNTISFVGLPTCFKWYQGGISITSKDKLEDKWINCFYNRDQAIKGQQMLDRIITKKFKWNKKESNWVKQSADVMRQIYDTLR